MRGAAKRGGNIDTVALINMDRYIRRTDILLINTLLKNARQFMVDKNLDKIYSGGKNTIQDLYKSALKSDDVPRGIKDSIE